MSRNLPQKLSVPLSQLTRTIQTDEITVKTFCFNDHSSFAPLPGRIAVLVLDLDLITRLERRELPSSSGQSLLHREFPLTVSLRSGVRRLSPLLSGEELSWLERQGVTENSSVQDLSWREASDGTGSVPVSQQSFDQSVSVQGASLGDVATDQSLGMFDCQFCSLVSPRVVGSGDTMDNSPPRAEIFKNFRCEDSGSVTGEGCRDPVQGDVFPENFDDIFTLVLS